MKLTKAQEKRFDEALEKRFPFMGPGLRESHVHFMSEVFADELTRQREELVEKLEKMKEDDRFDGQKHAFNMGIDQAIKTINEK